MKMNRNFLLAVLVTTVVSFFGGWLVFGMLMMDYYTAHTTEVAKAAMRPEADVVMWAIVGSNLVFSLLLAWILQKTGEIGFMRGFKTGLLVSFLVMLSFDLGMYAFWNAYDMQFLLMDIVLGTLFWGLMAGVAGWMLGRGNPATA